MGVAHRHKRSSPAADFCHRRRADNHEQLRGTSYYYATIPVNSSSEESVYSSVVVNVAIPSSWLAKGAPRRSSEKRNGPGSSPGPLAVKHLYRTTGLTPRAEMEQQRARRTSARINSASDILHRHRLPLLGLIAKTR
jgi:hypothetical protein